MTRPVSGPADEEIKAYSMDLDTGGLELRTTSKAHGPIGSLHLHRASGIVYGAQVLSTELSSYHLDTDTGEKAHGVLLNATNSIVGFDIAVDGTLSPFGHFSVPSSPRSFNIDPSGHFCYCTGEAAGRLRAGNSGPPNTMYISPALRRSLFGPSPAPPVGS
jgi:6-phosphogluconolactonase (cycloisomerase 2 family)